VLTYRIINFHKIRNFFVTAILHDTHFALQNNLCKIQYSTNLMYSSRPFFFSCILLSAFSFLSTSIRNPASIWDRTNIILIVTGVEVVIGNCLPVYPAPLSKKWRLKHNGVTTLIFLGHVTSLVMWPFDSRWSTSYGWSVVTMRLASTVMKIWPFVVLPGRLFQEQWSVGRSSILHWFHILLFGTLGT